MKIKKNWILTYFITLISIFVVLVICILFLEIGYLIFNDDERKIEKHIATTQEMLDEIEILSSEKWKNYDFENYSKGDVKNRFLLSKNFALYKNTTYLTLRLDRELFKYEDYLILKIGSFLDLKELDKIVFKDEEVGKVGIFLQFHRDQFFIYVPGEKSFKFLKQKDFLGILIE